MSKVIIEENQEYIVFTESIITSFDRKVLTRLYQPLIGSTGFSLFETLLSELEFDKTITSLKKEIKSLVNLMNSNIDDLRLSISKLEGVGLVKSFFDKKNNYFMFELFSPLTPKGFFDDPFLDSKLNKQLGSIEYERTKQYFSYAKISKDDFVDVSDNFSDVYEFDPNAIFNGSSNQRGKKSGKIVLSFDQEAFDLKLKELQIPKSKISKDDLENIIIYAASYHIPSVDMASIVGRCLDGNGQINIELLKKLAESKCINKSSNNIKTTIKDTGNLKLNDLINLYNSTNAKAFLTTKNKGVALLPSEVLLIEKLRNIYGFNDGIINCLLDYAISKSDGILNSNYIETIAISMKRAGINDTYQAYEYLNKTKTSESVKNTKSKQEESNNNESNKSEEEAIKESLRIIEELRKKRENGEN